MLFTAQGCARLRTGLIIMQIPRGYEKKSLLCRKARYVRSFAKKPPFWPSQRLKKVLFTAQAWARLCTGLIIAQIPRGYQEKSLLCRKARYVRSLAKTTHFWPSQRLKKVLFTAQAWARLCTGLIIAQIPRGYQEKSLLCRKARYVRSLAKTPHFWPSQRLKKVLFTAQGCPRLRTGPIIMQIPRGYHKKKFIVYKVCHFVDKVGISVLTRVGWVPQKSAGFGATAPAQKHPSSRCGTKKHSICHNFYRIWRY